jgi:hypothetical protein
MVELDVAAAELRVALAAGDAVGIDDLDLGERAGGVQSAHSARLVEI